jgi:Uma2 family endonuclease
MPTTQAISTPKKIPTSLIYEVMDGQPLYYKGYQFVLKKQKTLADIMGSSKLQFIIISYLLKLLFQKLDDDTYYIGTNEVGLHLGLRDNLSSDIVIFDKQLLINDKIEDKYASVAPKIVIEVDTKADLATSDKLLNYTMRKTQKLLDFGVERVIWIFTQDQRILVADKQQPDNWNLVSWNQDILIMNGISFNIDAYLKKQI